MRSEASSITAAAFATPGSLDFCAWRICARPSSAVSGLLILWLKHRQGLQDLRQLLEPDALLDRAVSLRHVGHQDDLAPGISRHRAPRGQQHAPAAARRS